MKPCYELCITTMLFLSVFINDIITDKLFPYMWLYILICLGLLNSLIFTIIDYVKCYKHGLYITLDSLLISNILIIILRAFQIYYWKKIIHQEELYTVFQCIMILGQIIITIRILLKIIYPKIKDAS